jgi:ATP-dependent DNA helicase RecG
MLTDKEIKELVEGGESYNVDFKRSVPSKIRDLTEEVCSFANAAGGYVFIGVDDNNRIVGCDIDNAKRSAIHNSLGEITPALHYEMYSCVVDGKTVWVIDIPGGNRKPYFYGGSTFIREGANSLKITNVDDIRDFFQRNERIYFDALPAPKVKFNEELDAENFREFRLESGYSVNISDEQILENLQIFGDDGVPFSGGVLFFNRQPEKYYFHAVIRCVLFKGRDKVIILDDKTFGGPLVQQYKKAMQWLQNNLRLSYIIEGAGPRREVWEVPMAVFKEAIINALAHRDYYEQGASITVEMFDDRVEITNPGGLLPLVAKNFGKKSLSRNPLIFGLLTRMHLVEHIGSGIPRMAYEMSKVGLPEPIYATEGMFTVTFRRPQSVDNIQIKSTEVDPAVTVSDIQARILNILSNNPKATLFEVASALNVSRSTVSNHLKALRLNNLISRVGRKSDGKWVVNK